MPIETKRDAHQGHTQFRRRVLMIAYHFPPMAGSSGIQRTLRLVQQLPAFGWDPLVLSVHPRAYERVGTDLLAEVPPDCIVRRAFALDSARHLSFRGRYFGALARPDRWRSWKFDGVRQGLRLIREFEPSAIWSTYPVPTAHVIGRELQRRSGLPWIADFRDPMAQDGYPADPRTWQAFDRIECETVNNASMSVFTTPGAAREYGRRYPEVKDRIAVVENGYDEASFAATEQECTHPEPLVPGAVTLLHSGIIYPEERDPTRLLEAVATLARRGLVSPENLRLRFRAAVHDALIQQIAAASGVADFVETLPPIAYRPALNEMRSADALLVLQSAGCNAQVPAKVYEYLRAGRPMACLADPAGDTAGVLLSAGLRDIAPLDDAAAISHMLESFLRRVRERTADLPAADAVRRASREHRCQELAVLLDRVSTPTSFPPRSDQATTQGRLPLSQ